MTMPRPSNKSASIGGVEKETPGRKRKDGSQMSLQQRERAKLSTPIRSERVWVPFA